MSSPYTLTVQVGQGGYTAISSPQKDLSIYNQTFGVTFFSDPKFKDLDSSLLNTLAGFKPEGEYQSSEKWDIVKKAMSYVQDNAKDITAKELKKGLTKLVIILNGSTNTRARKSDSFSDEFQPWPGDTLSTVITNTKIVADFDAKQIQGTPRNFDLVDTTSIGIPDIIIPIGLTSDNKAPIIINKPCVRGAHVDRDNDKGFVGGIGTTYFGQEDNGSFFLAYGLLFRPQYNHTGILTIALGDNGNTIEVVSMHDNINNQTTAVYNINKDTDAFKTNLEKLLYTISLSTEAAETYNTNKPYWDQAKAAIGDLVNKCDSLLANQ